MRACATSCLLALAAFGVPRSVHAAPTPAGTVVENVAHAEHTTPQGDAVEESSNAATTMIATSCTLDPFLLSVAPSGPVAPGTLLTYTVTATNRTGVALPAVEFTVTVDAALTEIALLPAPAPLGTAVAAFDPTSRVITWELASPLPADATIALGFQARVRPDAVAGSTVTIGAAQRSPACVGLLASNSLATTLATSALTLALSADRGAVAPGDGVEFALAIENSGAAFTLTGVVVTDTLPGALRYVPGTTRIGSAAAPDPAVGSDGRTLTFPVADLDPGTARTIRFGARTLPTAIEGEIVNRAVANAIAPPGVPVASLPVSAGVRVVPGPFRQEAVVMGRVYVDDDRDGTIDPGEPGVPGVIVLLEDGRGAVSDVTGQFHVDGVRPGLHVARVDPRTLPAPLATSAPGVAWAGDAASRFVEARASAIEVVDFPVGPSGTPRCRLKNGAASLDVPAAALVADARDGGEKSRSVVDGLAGYFADLGETDPESIAVTCRDADLDLDALRALLRQAFVARSTGDPSARASVPPPAAPADAAAPPKDPLEELARHAERKAAIVYPADGSRAPRSATSIEVVYPSNARIELFRDDEPVRMDLIGLTTTVPARGVSASRFLSIKLRPGPNVFTFRAQPSEEGAALQTDVVTVHLPGPTVALAIAQPEVPCVADGVTPCALRVEALDEAGMRASDDGVVTLVIEGARLLDADADPRAEAHQVRLVDGAAVVRFAPPATPGRLRLAADANNASVEAFVETVPQRGPWQVHGLAEAHLAGDAGVEGDGGLPPGVVDAVTSDGARLAVLAQGPVLKRSHLTLSLDTAREHEPYRLFDRFAPDAFFPVTGDTSAEVAMTPRQGPLYVRLDGPAGFIAAGDLETGFTHVELARYDRRLTGAWGHVGNRAVMLDGFAASTEQKQARDIFAPDGTSGPYLLSHRPVVAYSESVIAETRDRWHPEDVIRRTVKLPNLDYALDPDSGTILFRGPIAPFDEDLNPIRIVVVYETRDGVEDRITAGVRVVGRPGRDVETGATIVHETREGSDYGLYGLDLLWRPRPGTTVSAEAAASAQDSRYDIAYRFQALSQATEALRWELHYDDLPAGFANTSLLSAPEVGGRRAGANVQWLPRGPWRLHGEALWQDDQANALTRSTAAVLAERKVGGALLSGGVRGVAFEGGGTSVTSALAEVGVKVPIGARWTGELFRAQVLTHDVAPGYPNRTAIGLGWEWKEGRRFTARHEIESGGDFPTRSRTLLGLESRIGANTRSLVGYTIEGGASGTTMRASSGIETTYRLNPTMSLLGSAAVVDTTAGDGSADFVAFAGGCEYRAGSSLVAARYEVNFGTTETRHMITASGVFRAAAPWTVFVRERLFVSDPNRQALVMRSEGLFGAAFRPLSGPVQFLLRVDHTLGDGSVSTPGGVTPGGVASAPLDATGTPARQPGTPGLGIDYARYGPMATRDAMAINLAAGFRIDGRNRLASTLVARRVGEEAATGIGAATTWLLSLHYTAQLHDRFTLGASLRRFAQNDTRTASYGHGLELGYLAFKNFWLGGGYNFAGFVDRTFPAADDTARGPFVSLRFKFDEASLASLKDVRLDRP
jgi:uncharacterized repeat protein (TIGR01451 family)